MTKLNLKKNSGFTLLEALVAVSILMVAVSAPITIAQKGLSSAVYSKDQMIASYLAQDVIEYIKNKRDEVSINNPNFDWDDLNILSGCIVDDITTSDNVGCQIDTTKEVEDAILPYSNSVALRKDPNSFYSYSNGGTETKFKRQVQIKLNDIGDNQDEALVVVTIRWGENILNVRTLIYNY